MSNDSINHPKHYTEHPSGIECIQITEHMNFNLGNAVKYIWRADLKHDAIEDLKKAVWYIEREIAKRAVQVDTPVPVPTVAAPEQWNNASDSPPRMDGMYRVQYVDGSYDIMFWDGAWQGAHQLVSWWKYA